MSQELKKIWVGGIYNWPVYTKREYRIANPEYPRHNWCDIDTTNQVNLDSVIAIYKKYEVDCISQRCGKGFHVWGDLVDYNTWYKIEMETKPFLDPRWTSHTIRITKKRDDEVWERPIYHKHRNEPPNWARAVMSFLCKVMRNEINPVDLYSSMHHSGLDKYFHTVVYPIEVKQ